MIRIGDVSRSEPVDEKSPLTVFFDGSCPLCVREMAFYRKRESADKIRWIDVSSSEAELPEGLSRDELMARFHVAGADGVVISGGAAFASLWRAIPGFGMLGRAMSRKPLVDVLELAYRAFLPARPFLQKIMRNTSNSCEGACLKSEKKK